ncbi:uncharacterized protein LOC125021379 [Mugil cephalus]|uniref:uncharacterized protein LOC125021379 n=1 Tax=Mugil cephalus TaxID=48193 RepID=UPI001FB5D9E6|nr:uncharacterized protein LOC125021379 [Mugil cephalus]
MDISFEQAMEDITWEEVVATIHSMAEDLLEVTPSNPPPASQRTEQDVCTQPGAAPCGSRKLVAAPALDVGQSVPIAHQGPPTPMQAGFTPADYAAPSVVSNEHAEQTMNEMEKVEDTFLMYIDEDTQDYCTPAPPPSVASTAVSEHAAVEVEVKNTMATLWSFAEDSLPHTAPPPYPLPPVNSAPPSDTAVPQHTGREDRGERGIAAPQLTEGISGESPKYPPPASPPSFVQHQPVKVQAFRGVNAGQCARLSTVVSTTGPECAVKDVGWKTGIFTPEHLPPESSASSAPLTVFGPTVSTWSGFTPSHSAAPSVVSRKRKSMNQEESGPYVMKSQNTSVKEERPHVAAAALDISDSVEPNIGLYVPQRAKRQRVTPAQMAQMEPLTSQFVLTLPYAAIPVTTCCIFHQPQVQYYSQYYGQYYSQYYDQYYDQYYNLYYNQ